MPYDKPMILKVIFFSLFSTTLSAAPHPTTSGSITNQISSGAVFSQFGFKLNYTPSTWTLTEKTTDQKQIDLKNQSARMTFTYDETKTTVNLETYVKKFLRDYNQFGFEVSGLQSIKNNSASNSIILDLNQKNKKTKGRQVFFQNGKRIVTATCVDESENYEKTAKDCNKILGSFYWK